MSDTSADAWPRTSREKCTYWKTHVDTHTGPTRGLYSVLCLSLVLNHCKIKGVNFFDKYWMAFTKGTIMSQLMTTPLAVKKTYMQHRSNTVFLSSIYKLKVSRFLKMWQELKNSTSKAVKSPFILYPAFALFSVKKYILIKWLWDDYLMYMYCIGSLFLFRIPLYITRDYIQYVLSTCSWRVHRNYISLFDNISDVKWQLQEPREWFIHRIGKITSHEAMHFYSCRFSNSKSIYLEEKRKLESLQN